MHFACHKYFAGPLIFPRPPFGVSIISGDRHPSTSPAIDILLVHYFFHVHRSVSRSSQATGTHALRLPEKFCWSTDFSTPPHSNPQHSEE
jgi:hypothetical protein